MDHKNYNIVDGFNLIAPAYDLANDAMTLGLHRLWRRALCKAAVGLTPKGGRLLDVATGTGDVLFGLVKIRADLDLTGVDPSQGMLDVAREKIRKNAPLFEKQITLAVGDARTLSFPDATFDTVTISWGIRNVIPFQDGLKEMLRVLKPGGHLVVLESGRPEFKAVRAAYKYYARLLPYIGGRISGYMPAYKYYLQSADAFPSGQGFVAELFEAGFVNAGYTPLGGSIVYLYTAQKSSKKTRSR